MNAKKVMTIYGKHSNIVEYEYRGKTYEVEYATDWTYGNGENPKQQHKDAQAKIDREIEEESKPKKEVRYEDTAEYGFNLFWDSIN